MKLKFETEQQASQFIEDNPHLELIDSDGDRYYFDDGYVIYCSGRVPGICSRNNHALGGSFFSCGLDAFAKFKVTLKGTAPSKNDMICAIFSSMEDLDALRELNPKKQFKVCKNEGDGLIRCIISKRNSGIVVNES